MQLETLSENKHDELLALLNPLVDFMNKHEYNYFIVAGKDGTCSRYLAGDYFEVASIIEGLTNKHKQLKSMLKDIVEDESQSDSI